MSLLQSLSEFVGMLREKKNKFDELIVELGKKLSGTLQFTEKRKSTSDDH